MNSGTLFGLLLFALASLSGCSGDRRITVHSQEALKSYNIGVSQWERFYYVEALSAFDDAIHADSNFALAWARRAVLYDALQNRARALDDIAHAMTLLPSITEYERFFIRLQDHRLTFATKEAMELVDSMAHIYPEEKEVHLIRGGLYEFNKKYEDAIRSYKQAIDIDTSYALAVMSLGYAYSTVGEQGHAVSQMERYIRLAPDAADPRASFADILLRVGRYDEALEQYQKSLELKPDYWYSANQVGLICMIRGRLKAAEEQFHKGLAALPQSGQLQATHYAVDGNLNLLRGRYKEAIEQHREALLLDSTNSEAAYGLVNAFRKLKNFNRAHEVLGRIHLELERRNQASSQFMLRYDLTLSRLLLDEGETEMAHAFCDSALEFTTALSRGPVFQQIAEIDVRVRRYEDAFDACEEALRVNPNSPEALLTLLKAYRGKGDALMTKEIGGRLLEFWKDADPDFVTLHELQQLLVPHTTSGSASSYRVTMASNLD